MRATAAPEGPTGRLLRAHPAIRFAVRYLSVPGIIAATGVTFHVTGRSAQAFEQAAGLPPGSIPFVAAAVVLALGLVLIEAIFPFEAFVETEHQRSTDVAFNVGTAVVLLAGHGLVVWVPTPLLDGSGLNRAVQFVIAWAGHDLLLYGWHRLLHESGSRALWRLHAWHHEPRRFTFMAGGRTHLLEIAVTVLALAATRLVLGVSADVMLWVVLCPVVSGAVHHTNVDFRLGPLNFLFPGPEMHRAHHDRDPAAALNYATSFPLWDVLFGTARPLRAGGETDYGMHGRDDRRTTWRQVHGVTPPAAHRAPAPQALSEPDI